MSDIDTCPHCSGMLVGSNWWTTINCLDCNFIIDKQVWLGLFE